MLSKCGKLEAELLEKAKAAESQREEIGKLKGLLIAKDKEIAKLTEDTNRDVREKAKKEEEKNLDVVRVCSHEGLLLQL
jgi:hypothetical protein